MDALKIKNFLVKSWNWIKEFFILIYDHLLTYVFSYLSLTVFLIGVLWIFNYANEHFEKDYINDYELRLYIISFLLLFLIMTFAVLRMYNATVANTSFIIKLRAEIRKLTVSLNTATQAAGKTRALLRNIQGSIQKLFNLKKDE